MGALQLLRGPLRIGTRERRDGQEPIRVLTHDPGQLVVEGSKQRPELR